VVCCKGSNAVGTMQYYSRYDGKGRLSSQRTWLDLNDAHMSLAVECEDDAIGVI